MVIHSPCAKLPSSENTSIVAPSWAHATSGYAKTGHTQAVPGCAWPHIVAGRTKSLTCALPEHAQCAPARTSARMLTPNACPALPTS
jgi:hypothetical protein